MAPGGKLRHPRQEGLAAQGGGIHAKQMGEFVGHAFEHVLCRDQAEDGLVHALGQAGGGAPSGQHIPRAVLLGAGMGAFYADHGGHVVGQRLAMNALRRGQHAVQLRTRGQKVRIGAEVVGDGLWVHKIIH